MEDWALFRDAKLPDITDEELDRAVLPLAKRVGAAK
jgi:hypothetical protein